MSKLIYIADDEDNIRNLVKTFLKMKVMMLWILKRVMNFRTI